LVVVFENEADQIGYGCCGSSEACDPPPNALIGQGAGFEASPRDLDVVQFVFH
jgi:hypothetical protein